MNKLSKKDTYQQEETVDNAPIKADSLTPMMQQYIDIKSKHSEYLLFYRMGDFYELFFEDAELAAKELDIVLTKRGKKEGDDIPMCGVPHHSHESYLNKLIKKGYKIAICEQIETPEEAKKQRGYKAVVKREVTRIVTQGTITDEKLLEKDSYNNLSSIYIEGDLATIAWCDISTGEVYVNEIDKINIASEVERINTTEIVISDDILSDRNLKGFIDQNRGKITSQNNNFFNINRAKDKILSFFGIKDEATLRGFTKIELNALGGLLEYIEITQLNNKPNLSFPKSQRESNFMEIDSSTFKNLEIFRDSDGKRENSLFGILNKNQTSAGSRLLQNYIARPLKNVKEINKRYDGVEFFIKNEDIKNSVSSLLSKFPDIERISARIFSNRGNPRDLVAIKDGLYTSLKISEIFTFTKVETPKIISDALTKLGKLEKLFHLINEAVIDFPPLNLNQGGFIRPDYNSKLDDYRNIKATSESLKNDLLEKYRRKTDISNLKIKENNVIGMFFETNPNNVDKIPTNFVHKQTLANCVRYTSDELREIENKIINADSYAIALELEIYIEVKEKICDEIENLRILSGAIAQIDILLNFAKISIDRNYIRPEINNSKDFNIVGGRHAVVELAMKRQKTSDTIDYCKNDSDLSIKNIWLLTGPNMSGKSTFLRQNTILCLIAQIGCYIPADSAKIGLVDKLFSRVGASDNLSRGQSTFMVEMSETAFILNNATDKSLIILDEIGRGTSTFDGLSIAWATLENLSKKINCRSLFATHYHELTELAKSLKNIVNCTLETSEWEGDIIFKHKVIEGIAKESYGIHVAQLAGIPSHVTTRANEILNILKEQNKGNSIKVLNENLPLFSNEIPYKRDSGALKTNNSSLEELNELKKFKSQFDQIDINNTTPIEAFNFLLKIKG